MQLYYSCQRFRTASQLKPGQLPDPKNEFIIVKTLLQRLHAMLTNIAAKQKGFVVVPTQGTLTPSHVPPQPGDIDWQNEIHPSSVGFEKIAMKFREALAAVFS
jgi:hypothetical protein